MPRPRHVFLDFFGTLVDDGARASESTFVGDTFDADHTGPRALGMRALLIDPASVHPIEPAERLEHILDLPQALGFCTV